MAGVTELYQSLMLFLGNNTLSRPKSLLVCSPSTKLLSLEEAQARTQAHLSSPATTPCLTHSDYIEVGEGPGALLGKFHTVIELPMERYLPVPLVAYNACSTASLVNK